MVRLYMKQMVRLYMKQMVRLYMKQIQVTITFNLLNPTKKLI